MERHQSPLPELSARGVIHRHDPSPEDQLLVPLEGAWEGTHSPHVGLQPQGFIVHNFWGFRRKEGRKQAYSGGKNPVPMDTSQQLPSLSHQGFGHLSGVKPKLSEPRRAPQEHRQPGLTYKLRGPKYILEFIPSFNLVGDPEVDEFDARVWHILVQQHDVLRLWGKRSWHLPPHAHP